MKMGKRTRARERTSIWIHLFFILIALLCLLPMLLVVSASFSTDANLSKYGFTLIPKEFSTTAYAYLFKNPSQIFNAYAVTIFITVAGTFLSVLFMSMAAYSLSRPQFRAKKFMSYFIFFPTLFSGGLVSMYLINTQYLHLTDSLWALILPGLVNVFHIFMIRTFFKELPSALFDAAKIDGANEIQIYFRIGLPLSKPVLATVAFLGALNRWNEWYNAMLYIRSSDKYPLQYLLQRMMMNIQELIRSMKQMPGTLKATDIPGESLRMALLIICIGPVMLFFPFFQKYFTKGMTVGSVKG